jgi:hypothetical protein
MVSSRKLIGGVAELREASGECNNRRSAADIPPLPPEAPVPDAWIEREDEDGDGWTFHVRIAAEPGDPPSRRTLRLAWADYDLWSADGADPPHTVALAVIAFLLARMPPSDLPERIDAATARRRFADADAEIPGMIRRESH